MTDVDLCSQRVKAIGNKFICGPMSFKSSILFISPKLWATGSNPVGSTKYWSHRVVVILPACHAGDTSSILVGTAI